jgi:hypothetical protein
MNFGNLNFDIEMYRQKRFTFSGLHAAAVGAAATNSTPVLYNRTVTAAQKIDLILDFMDCR